MPTPFQLASGWRRIKAFGYDYLAIAAYLVSLASLGGFLVLGPLADGWRELLSTPTRIDLLALLLAVVPVVAYFAVSEARRGATWGKRRMGISVCTGDGTPPSLGRSTLRAALKLLPWQLAHTAILHIPGFPLDPQPPPPWSVALLGLVWSLVALYLVGLTAIMQRQTLYDRLSGTIVVVDEPDDG